MGQKEVSTPLVVTVIAVLVVVVGFFLYRGVTGGTVGTGEPGKVLAAPPVPGENHQLREQGQQSPGQNR